MISIIVAHANKQVIGRGNDLPWNMPADLKRFKEITTGHTVIVGDNTFKSIVKRLGHPLPNRTTIVVSQTMPPGEGYIVVPTVADAIRHTTEAEEAFIIGGARLYASTLGIADKVYLTKIDADIPGDTYFPQLSELDGWVITDVEKHDADERNEHPYRFITLEKRFS